MFRPSPGPTLGAPTRQPSHSQPHQPIYPQPTSYQPHTSGSHNGYASNSSDPDPSSNSNILNELDKAVPLKSFDAFPKIQSSYQPQTLRGGLITFAVAWTIFLLVLNDLGEYLYGQSNYSFNVDGEIGTQVQLNVDLTVAMPCHFLSVDIRDAVGDRVYLTDDLQKDGTVFEPAGVQTFKRSSDASSGVSSTSASEILSQTAKRRSSGLRSLFSFGSRKRKHPQYRKTRTIIQDGPACRIYGSMLVKKVTANLHVTTLGHGYMSWEHTDHSLMNLSHVIHEWSFGEYFPSISQPLDMTMEISDEPFSIFQYFLTVVPTRYINASGRKVDTNQYSVTDYVRVVDHGKGVPGIFFKYDLEPLALTIHERTTTFYQFLIRLVGVIGGVWTCTSFALRAIARFERVVNKAKKGKGRERSSSEGFLGNKASKSAGFKAF
ncbi:COPII vesicle protein [Phaffia rhodozyma]|uniref:COPII vesicle protein n=1 Tax=Phaffia rhodozyma TaxID=264483 RepID=A0A0F7SFH4_PHARH|nr:COPII vesicle protein [Phaffia rhodozyma]